MPNHPAPTQARTPTRLIAANAALLAVLACLTIAGMNAPADAQSRGAQRGRGEYTMVSGNFQGGSASAVYLIDSTNQEVVALTWNRTKHEFEPLALRSMIADSQRQSTPR
jgi:hypothetical protein